MLQNREGNRDSGAEGELRDPWPSNLHFQLGFCFSFTCRMSEKFPGLSVKDFFSLVTIHALKQIQWLHYHWGSSTFVFYTWPHTVVCTHIRPNLSDIYSCSLFHTVLITRRKNCHNHTTIPVITGTRSIATHLHRLVLWESLSDILDLNLHKYFYLFYGQFIKCTVCHFLMKGWTFTILVVFSSTICLLTGTSRGQTLVILYTV